MDLLPGPHAPDLSSLDFFLWGALKADVYETPVESEMDRVARLVCSAPVIQENPGVFDNPWSVCVIHALLAMVETLNIFCNISRFICFTICNIYEQ